MPRGYRRVVTTVHASAILLDMDGTLVDSTAVVERLWTEWGAKHGLDPAYVLSVVHGRQSHESMAILLPDRPREENLADSAVMVERETAETEGIAEIAGAVALVRSLAHVPHALVTSATRALAKARMEVAGMTMPQVSVTAEDVTASKPDPEGFLRAAEGLGVPPGHCVVLEDSFAGITAARRAGMRVLGIGAAAADHDPDWFVPDLTGVRVASGRPDLIITLPD